jgi:hypothetical protein
MDLRVVSTSGDKTEPSADSGLELSTRGLRFVVPATEVEYLAWQRVESMRLNRAGLIGGIVVGAVQGVLFAIAGPVGFMPWLVLIVALEAFNLAAVVAGRGPSAHRWFQPLVAVINALSGLMTVSILSLHLHLPDIAFAAAVALTYIAFAAYRMRPLHAALASASYVVLQLALTVHSFRAGGLSVAELLFPVVMLPALFGNGLQTSLVAEIALRQSFRQQRIIERQKETISRERARSEDLLRKELGHQVAERSRELGAAFTREAAPFDARELRPGERFDARYRIVEGLGAGGMGAVYEVERLTDGQRLALKVVVGEVSGIGAARFAREAEIGARVHHANLVSIVDVGVSAGIPFLVMEIMRGGSLEARREAFGDPGWALPILRQIAEGLQALHAVGVVHRDLKPSNVLMTSDAEPAVAKISDFGISRVDAIENASVDASAATLVADTPRRASALTGTGVVMGTPLYMAPEAARGERVDAPNDLFALGIIAYEMLTGRAPFTVAAALLAQADQPIPPPPPICDARVPASLGALVLECLLPDPAARPSARVFVSALAAHMDEPRPRSR